MKTHLLLSLGLVISTAAFAQTTGPITPTVPATPKSPTAVSSANGTITGHTPNAVSGFAPNPVSGFTPNAVSGFSPRPVTGIAPDAVQTVPTARVLTPLPRNNFAPTHIAPLATTLSNNQVIAAPASNSVIATPNPRVLATPNPIAAPPIRTPANTNHAVARPLF